MSNVFLDKRVGGVYITTTMAIEITQTNSTDTARRATPLDCHRLASRPGARSSEGKTMAKKNPLAGIKLLSAVTDNGTTITYHVYMAETAKLVQRDIDRVLRAGGSQILKDGTRQWITTEVVINTDRPCAKASDIYIWNKDGERVLCNLVLNSLSPDRVLSRKVITQTWKAY